MRRLMILALVATWTGTAAAQDVLVRSTAWGFAPVVSGWHFSTPLMQPAGAIQDVAEAAMPFHIRTTAFDDKWTFDITGAYAAGAIHLTSGDSSGGGGSGNGGGGNSKVLLLNGPTDVKLRVTGPLISESLMLTLGVNLPTGLTGLDADQSSVLEAIAAPALGMPVSAFGTGPGATIGLIRAFQAGDWALALGAAAEQRSEYTPISLAVATGTASTKITPGFAAHLSLGADRAVGDDRLSMLVVADGFGQDKVLIGDGGSDGTQFNYTLGPQVTTSLRLDMAGQTWREAALDLSARYRSAFTDATKTKVAGSSGTYLEGSLGGVLGGAQGAGLVLGVDGRWQSGLSFTSDLVGTAATVGGATLGFEAPMGGAFFRFALHGQYGTFDTGVMKTAGFGGALILSFAQRSTGGAP